MRRVWLVLLFVFLAATACNLAFPPVKVIPSDIFDRAVPESVGPIGYEAGREWIGNLGQTVDGGVISLDYARFVWREYALLGFAVIVGLLFRRYPRRAASSIAWAGQRIWLLPLALYGVVALWRLVYVPCSWLVTVSLRWHLTRQASGILPLWQVGTEDVRYGLVLFEEIVLLACVAAWYGAAYALSPRLRSRISNLGK